MKILGMKMLNLKCLTKSLRGEGMDGKLAGRFITICDLLTWGGQVNES